MIDLEVKTLLEWLTVKL